MTSKSTGPVYPVNVISYEIVVPVPGGAYNVTGGGGGGRAMSPSSILFSHANARNFVPKNVDPVLEMVKRGVRQAK